MPYEGSSAFEGTCQNHGSLTFVQGEARASRLRARQSPEAFDRLQVGKAVLDPIEALYPYVDVDAFLAHAGQSACRNSVPLRDRLAAWAKEVRE
jgi:hypothetical protein